MGATFRDRLGSLFMLVFIAILWFQRDYTTPFGGIFPDRIMILMAAFVVVTLILSFTPYRVMKEEDEKASEGKQRWGDMAVVIAIMFAWVLLLRYAGFALTSVVGFTSIAWYISGEKKNWRTIVKALAIALVITFLIVYIFGHLLLVPIPPGEIFE